MLYQPLFSNHANCAISLIYIMGHDATKPVFMVSDKVRLKPVSSAMETSSKIEISLEASLDMILCNKGITKALIRLCVCRRQVFSH